MLLSQPLQQLVLFRTKPQYPANQRLPGKGEFQLKSKKYVRANGHRKGAPNISQKGHHKGVYFDGHERDDVVESRQQFLDRLVVLDDKTRTGDTTPDIPEGEKPLIRVVHESTFYSNADRSRYWCDNDSQVLKQKSLGSSIMVSDFIDEMDGYLRHDGKETRVLLETQTEGYFNNDS